MRVSVIIPCRNEARHIEACLCALVEHNTSDHLHEIIVADGRSDDDTRDRIGAIALIDHRIRLVDNPERTTSAGLNAAIAEAVGDIIIRIDAHTEYAPDYIRQCLLTLQATNADNVGGPWVARGHNRLQCAIAAAFASKFGGGGRAHDVVYEGHVDTVYLGCWRRDVFDRFGRFDEELIRNQDDEFNFRVIKAGGTIWQSPRIRSWYTPRSSLPALFKQYFQYGYWKVRVMQKHGQPASLRHLVPGTFASALVALLLFSPIFLSARWALGMLVALYLSVAFVASVVTAARTGWRLLPILPAVFATYHFSYGFGFLAGVWDFMIRKRRGRFISLTRG